MRLLARIKKLISRFRLIPQYCHRCGRDLHLTWSISDEKWDSEAGEKYEIMCLDCYADVAKIDFDETDFIILKNEKR